MIAYAIIYKNYFKEDMKMAYYLGIDLGGTNIAVGVVDENYVILGRGKN